MEPQPNIVCELGAGPTSKVMHKLLQIQELSFSNYYIHIKVECDLWARELWPPACWHQGRARSVKLRARYAVWPRKKKKKKRLVKLLSCSMSP